MTKPYKLATILAVTFITLSLVSLFAAGTIQMWLNLQTQQEFVVSQQEVVAISAANDVRNLIERTFSTLEAVADAGRPFAATNADRRLLLHTLLRLQPTFYTAALYDSRGQELDKLTRHQNEISPTVLEAAHSDLFQQVQRGERYISAVYIDSLTLEPMITLAIPVKNSLEQIEGAIAVEVNLRFMWELVRDIQPRSGRVYVVDKTGNLLAASDEALVLEGVNLAHLYEVTTFIENGHKANQTDLTIAEGIEGDTVLTTHIPLDVPDWAVVIEVPTYEAYRPIIYNLLIAMFGAIGVAIFSGSVGIYLARRIAAPLLHVTEAATEISNGQLDRQVDPHGPAEIHQLATVFNTMTRQLSEEIDNRTAIANENKRLLLEAQETVIQLQELDQIKSEFLTNMSHEFRTPLNAILGFADVLQSGLDGQLPPAAQNDIELIYSSGQHLLILINDVLDISKLDGGMMELTMTVLDVAYLLDQVLPVIETLVKEKSIELRTDFCEPLPYVWADQIRLRQILINLLDNAVKFTNSGYIQLTITTESEYARFTIQDTGIGIPLNRQDIIFERFKQVDMSSTRQYSGTGLGLAITKALVEMHGGEIGLISTVGEGSEFFVTIPLAMSKDGIDDS